MRPLAFPIFTYESFPIDFTPIRSSVWIHQLRRLFSTTFPRKSNGTSLDLERASSDEAKPVFSTLSFIVNFFSPSNFFFKPFLEMGFSFFSAFKASYWDLLSWHVNNDFPLGYRSATFFRSVQLGWRVINQLCRANYSTIYLSSTLKWQGSMNSHRNPK